MVQLWSAFLSCDARDMCRVGPALIRNHLAWLAVVVRVVTIPPLVLPDMWIPRVTSDIYWSSRQGHPDYVEFAALVDEADQVRRALTQGELPKATLTNSLSLANRMREWDEESGHEFGLFCCLWVSLPSEDGCSPFHTWRGRFLVLTSEEERDGGYFSCDYSEFAY